MKEISDWIERLQVIEETAKSERPSVSEHYYPLLVRGFTPLSYAYSFFVVQPIGQVFQRVGDAGPIANSLLRLLDAPNLKVIEQHALADAIAALACAAFEGWVNVIPTIPMKVEGSDQVSFMNTSSMTDGSLNRPSDEFPTDSLKSWIEAVASLDSPHTETIGAAIRLHHGAVLLYDHDLRSAYLLLVAGIELLSRQYGSPPNDWNSWEDAKQWDKLMQSIHLSDEQSETVRLKLLADKHLRLKLTFRQYAAYSLRDSFWDKPYKIWNYGHHYPSGTFLPPDLFSDKPIGELLSRDREVVATSLGKSYDVRSGLVHRGETLHFFEAAMAPWNTVDGTKLVPFALLRHILLELISIELAHNARPVTLPNVKLLLHVSNS